MFDREAERPAGLPNADKPVLSLAEFKALLGHAVYVYNRGMPRRRLVIEKTFARLAWYRSAQSRAAATCDHSSPRVGKNRRPHTLAASPTVDISRSPSSRLRQRTQ